MAFPFAKPSDETQAAPQAETTVDAPQPEATEAPAAPVADNAAEATSEAKPKRKHNRQATKEITEEDIQYILSHVKTMSYQEMADARGLTKFQVNRVLMETKKGLREKVKGNPEAEAKVEAYIKEHLSRPEDSGPGKGGGKVKTALTSVVDSILGAI